MLCPITSTCYLQSNRPFPKSCFESQNRFKLNLMLVVLFIMSTLVGAVAAKQSSKKSSFPSLSQKKTFVSFDDPMVIGSSDESASQSDGTAAPTTMPLEPPELEDLSQNQCSAPIGLCVSM